VNKNERQHDNTRMEQLNRYLNSLSDDAMAMNLSSMFLKQLPDLSRFTNLRILYCSNNKIVRLPTKLPSTLQELDCSYNLISELPVIPDKLQILNCSNNHLNKLRNLPDGLQELYCGNNELCKIDMELPDSIKILNCRNNQITEFTQLPRELQEFNCSNNGLLQFPDLPDNLQLLICQFNILECLPRLPDGLQELNCRFNKLTQLPQLPCSLEILNCSYNRLTHLTKLKENLKKLCCSYNGLTSLPLLPNKLRFLELNDIHNMLEYIDSNDDLYRIRRKTQILNRFKYTFYLEKVRRRLRNWLYKNVIEKLAKKKYNPTNLIKIMGVDMDDIDNAKNTKCTPEIEEKIINWK